MLVKMGIEEKEDDLVSTRLLIISDTHEFQFKDNCDAGPFKLPVPKVDVLLHCGDLTHSGGVSAYENALAVLSNIDAELKLVIAGNHDLDLDPHYYKETPSRYSQAIEVMNGEQATRSNVKYLKEGTHTFTLRSGAEITIYGSPYTPDTGWAFPYRRIQDRFNSESQALEMMECIAENPVPNSVDIIMTHEPPWGILDECHGGNAGCQNVLQASRRTRPLLHCFGHIHEGHGAEIVDWDKYGKAPGPTHVWNEHIFGAKGGRVVNAYPEARKCFPRRGRDTLMVNASIMNEENEPGNAPWLIDLMLRKSSKK